MRKRTYNAYCFGAILAGLIVLVSCAAPRVDLTSVWKDKEYHGRAFGKVFVIGAARVDKNRILAEDELVRRLTAQGNVAFASHSYLTMEKMLDKASVVEKVKETGADCVLVARLLYTVPADMGPSTRQPRWDEFYTRSFGYERAGPSAAPAEKSIAYLDAKLYDVRTEKPVWSASAEMKVKENPKDEVSAFAAVVVQRLTAEKLIR